MSLRGLFITGTDTGVGKTRVACGVARALVGQGRQVGILKPFATSATLQADGTWASPDALVLRQALPGGADIRRINPISYRGDLAPSVAMRATGKSESLSSLWATIQDAMTWWAERCEILVVEGVGGWLCPLCEDAKVADVAVGLDYPVLVVARLGLGTLNHTLLTVESIQRLGLRVAGVILNSAQPEALTDAEKTNPEELSRWLGSVPILGVLPYSEEAETLSGSIHGVDWWDRAAGSRLTPD